MWEAAIEALKPQACATSHNASLKEQENFLKGNSKGLFLPLVRFQETERQRRQRLRLGCPYCVFSRPSTHLATILLLSSQNWKIQQSFTESLLCAKQGPPPVLGFSPRYPLGYHAHQKEWPHCWVLAPLYELGHNDHHHHSFIYSTSQGRTMVQ